MLQSTRTKVVKPPIHPNIANPIFDIAIASFRIVICVCTRMTRNSFGTEHGEGEVFKKHAAEGHQYYFIHNHKSVLKQH